MSYRSKKNSSTIRRSSSSSSSEDEDEEEDDMNSIYHQFDIHGNRLRRPINYGTKISYYVDEKSCNQSIINKKINDIKSKGKEIHYWTKEKRLYY